MIEMTVRSLSLNFQSKVILNELNDNSFGETEKEILKQAKVLQESAIAGSL